MSNSFKRLEAVAPQSDGADLLTQLLAGIAAECSEIGVAISKVGDELSEALTSTDMTRVMLECQAFDRLSQVAHAQARLIEHVGRLLLNGGPASSSELVSAIDGVPTFDVRRRLCAAIGVTGEDVNFPAQDDVDIDGDGLF